MNLKKNINEKDFLEFIKNTDQYNIFSEYKYLEIMNEKFDNYVLFKNNEPVIGTIQFHKSMFNLPIFYNTIFVSKAIKSNNKFVELVSLFLEQLSQVVNKIEFRCHPTVRDIRSFQWHNYTLDEKYKFNIKPFYTTKLQYNHKIDDIFRNFNSSRKNEIKKAEKNRLKSEITNDYEILNFLNKHTFKRERSKNEIFFSEILAKKSVDSNFGTIIVTRDSNKDIVAGSLFIHDDLTSYYMVGGSLLNKRNLGSASINIYHQIENSINSKKKILDFIGCNSPNRGFFKTSFGGDLMIYFELSVNNS